jgi:hypothetical protein
VPVPRVTRAMPSRGRIYRQAAIRGSRRVIAATHGAGTAARRHCSIDFY